MSKSIKLVFVVLMFVMVAMLVGCDGECTTCVADPFAKQDSTGAWVAQPTSQPDNAFQKADKAVSKAVYNTPTDRQLIETIGGGNTAKVLDEFAARCGRFGGTVAQKDIATLGCYK